MHSVYDALFIKLFHVLVDIFSMKVGLDFTPRFISKEEDKDVQREVFSRQVEHPFRLKMSFHIYHFTMLCHPINYRLLINASLFEIFKFRF